MKNKTLKKYTRKSLFKNFGINIAMGFVILVIFGFLPLHSGWFLIIVPLFILPLLAGMQWFYAHIYRGELKNVALVYDPATGDMVMPDHVSPHRPRLNLLFQPFQLGVKHYLKIVALQLLPLQLMPPYSQTLFLVMSNPDLRISEAFKESKQLMTGKNKQHLLANLSTLIWLLIPLALLVILSLYGLSLPTDDVILALIMWGLALLIINLLIGAYFLFWYIPYTMTLLGGFHRELVGDDWEEALRPKRQPLFANIMLGVGISLVVLSPNTFQMEEGRMVFLQTPFHFFNPQGLLVEEPESYTDISLMDFLSTRGVVGQEFDPPIGIYISYLHFPARLFMPEELSDELLLNWANANRHLTDGFSSIRLNLTNGSRLWISQTFPEWDLSAIFHYQIFNEQHGFWESIYIGESAALFNWLPNPFDSKIIWTGWNPLTFNSFTIRSPFGGERVGQTDFRYYFTHTYDVFLNPVLDDILTQWDLTPVPNFTTIEEVKQWASSLDWDLTPVFANPNGNWVDPDNLANYVLDHVFLSYVGWDDTLMWVQVRPR